MKDIETPKRKYRMVARADATAATRERILDAAGALFGRSPKDGPLLEEVAKDAETTVQTVLRHFGSKEGLLEAALRRASQRVRTERGQAPVGDVPGAVRNLVAHYERYGDFVLRLLAEEDRIRFLRTMTDHGREIHREWVEHTFAPELAELDADPGARALLLAQLVAVCDVYVWKLLRRDMKLTVPQAEVALVELIEGLGLRS